MANTAIVGPQNPLVGTKLLQRGVPYDLTLVLLGQINCELPTSHNHARYASRQLNEFLVRWAA